MHQVSDEEIVRQYILKRLAKQGRGLGKTAIGPDTRLFDKNLLDSFGVLELYAFLEEVFGIHFEKDELKPESIGSLNSLLTLVRSKKRA